ncbi:MAG: YihY/virulence factor BrkB family protein [Bryobacteraceae bacterium]
MPLESPGLYVTPLAPWHRWWRLLQGAIVASLEDNVFGIAKGAAYSGLLAFFPVLASLAAILAQVKAEAVSHVISLFLFEVVPPGSENLIHYVFTVKGQRPVALLISATILSVWAASGVIISLMEGFEAAHKLPSARPFLANRAMAVFLVVITFLPAIGASALIVFGNRTESDIMQWIGLLPSGKELPWSVILLSRILRYLLAFATIVFVNGLLYYFGPNSPVRFKRVWPGAFLSTIVWLLATSGFAWYVRHMAKYNLIYGSIGTFIAMLIWIYLLAVITLIGCEFNVIRDQLDAN